MVIVPVIVALYANYKSVYIAMIAAALCIVARVSIFIFEIVTWRKTIYCKKFIKKYTEALWQLNFDRYSYIIRRQPFLDGDPDEYWRLLEYEGRWLRMREQSLEEKETELEKKKSGYRSRQRN